MNLQTGKPDVFDPDAEVLVRLPGGVVDNLADGAVELVNRGSVGNGAQHQLDRRRRSRVDATRRAVQPTCPRQVTVVVGKVDAAFCRRNGKNNIKRIDVNIIKTVSKNLVITIIINFREPFLAKANTIYLTN